VNSFLNIFASIECKVKGYEELINGKPVKPNIKLFLSLIQKNQPVVLTKQSVVFINTL